MFAVLVFGCPYFFTTSHRIHGLTSAAHRVMIQIIKQRERTIMKIKIMLMLAIVCFAAAIQAQSQGTWLDDWTELQTTPAGALARYNPSAICETDWVSDPESIYEEAYDVCIVAGSHNPSVFWLVISSDDTRYVSRWLVQWYSPLGTPWHRHHGKVNLIQLINYYIRDKAHVVYLGSFETFPKGFDTIRILDLDSFESVSLTLPPQNP